MAGFLLWVFLASLGPVIEFDLWFRLRLAKELVVQGLALEPTHFLWSQPALADCFTPRYDRLFSLSAYALYRALGIAAFPYVTALLVTCMFWMLWHSLGKIGWAAPYRVLLLFVAFKLFEGRLMLRPQLITDLALACLVHLYLKDREKPYSRLPLRLGLFFLAWMSLHPGATVGLPVLFCLFAGEDLAARRFPKRGVQLTLAALAGCCLRPGGVAQMILILSHVDDGVDHPYNLEWQPANLQLMLSGAGVYLAFTIMSWLRGARRWKQGLVPTYLSGVLVSGGLWALALRQVRALGEVTGATPVLLAQMWGPLASPRRPIRLALGLLLAIGLTQQATRPQLFRTWPERLYPDGAVALLEREDPGAGVFCSYHWGGYLAFHNFQPFIHSMTTYFPAQRFQDYLALLRSPRAGQELTGLGLHWALLHYTVGDDVHAALARRLEEEEVGHGNWGVVYFDDTCMLFAGPGTHLPIYRAIQPALPNPVVGPAPEARAEIDRLAQTLGSQAPLVLQLRAQLAESQNLPQEALANWNATLAVEPGRASALLARGSLLFREGRLEDCQADFRAYLKLHPESVVGHFNLAMSWIGRAQRQDQSENLKHAKMELDEALRLDPQFEPARRLRNQLQSP